MNIARSMMIFFFALAIARFEGFFLPGSRARRNNNPGNLRGWDPGLPVDPQGFDIFPNIDRGLSALFRQVNLNFSRGLTTEEFIKGRPLVYPGYSRTDQDAYVRFLVENTPVRDKDLRIESEIRRLQRQIDEFERSRPV